jgi:hypothetical protein
MSASRFWCLLVTLLALSILSPLHAATLNVPAQYPTIQAGIDAAHPGDTVLVDDGTYTGPGNVDLDFGGKDITVESVNGAASTIIDCQGSESSPHRAFYLHSGETASAKISGFTIENGYAPIDSYGDSAGGGIDVDPTAAATITGCTVVSCKAAVTTPAGSEPTGGADGGGIEAAGSNSVITDCTVTGNTVTSNTTNFGGGIDAGSSVTIRGCTITGNTAVVAAGIYAGAHATITRCTVSDNTAQGDTDIVGPGGIYTDVDSIITHCAISGNSAVPDNSSPPGDIIVGGLYFNGGVVIDCVISGNTSLANTNYTYQGAGGLYLGVYGTSVPAA